MKTHNYLELPGSSSNSINKLHPLIPQGSRSDNLIISADTRCKRSAGNRTSVHAKCLLFANLSSFCKRIVKACKASSCDGDVIDGSCDGGGVNGVVQSAIK